MADIAVWTETGYRPSAALKGAAPGGDMNEYEQREQILDFVRTSLEGKGCPLPSSFDDFSDGIILIHLLETLTGETIKRYSKCPRLQIQKIENIDICIVFMESFFKLKVFGCSPLDIVQGNEKQVFGLLFLLWTRVRQMRIFAKEMGMGSCADFKAIKQVEEENEKSARKEKKKGKEGEDEDEDEEEEEDDDEEEKGKEDKEEKEKQEEREEKKEEDEKKEGDDQEGKEEDEQKEGGDQENKEEKEGQEQNGIQFKEADQADQEWKDRRERRHKRERSKGRCSGFIGNTRGVNKGEGEINGSKVLVPSFVTKFGKKDVKKMTELEADRLIYLYDQFKEPEHLKNLVRLQAVVRRIQSNKALQAKVNRRNKIAQEILSTERSYKVGLDTLTGVYQEPLLKSGIITNDSAKAMFGSLSIVLGMCNRLLSDLEDRLAAWTKCGQKIADIFLGIVPMLKIYTDYVNNYNTALEEISKQRRTNKEFRTFMKSAIDKCHGTEINSFLVLPIQRIPRYVMLLEQMYKYTPESHPDHAPLAQVVVDIRDVADYVNDKKRAAESQMQVKKCYDQITGVDFELVSPSRRYVYEGFLFELDEKQRLRERYVFLFNDLFLVSAHHKNRKFGSTNTRELDLTQNEEFAYKYSVEGFEGMEVSECEYEDPSEGKKKGKTKGLVGFSILGKDIKTKEKLSCSFFTQDVKAQALWMARIDNGVADKVDGELSYLGLSPDSKFDKIEYMKEGRISYHTSSGKWLQRLLVLEKGTLSVNRVKGKQRLLKESVPLCCSSVRIAEVSSKENSFQVTAGSQILMFSAKTNEERYQWVNAIRHYIRLIISTKKEEALYNEKMKKDPNFIIKDLAKDQEECVDCGKKEISWANCSLGLFHCRQCGGIHRTLGYTPKLKTVGYGKWSMEEVEEFRRFTPEEIARWKTPEGVAKPSATDSHSAKFLFIEQKYGSLLKEEEPETDDTSTSTESSNPPKEDPGKKLEKGDKKSNSLGLTGLPDGGGSGGLKSERKEKKKKEKKKGK